MNDEYIKLIVNKLREHHINTYGFFLQVHRAHWDVNGMSFGPLHSLFQEIYEYLFEHIDDIGERQRQFKYFPTIMLGDLITSKYGPALEQLPAQELIYTVSNNFKSFIEDIRELLIFTNESIDFATTNWLSEVIQKGEKLLWKLESNNE